MNSNINSANIPRPSATNGSVCKSGIMPATNGSVCKFPNYSGSGYLLSITVLFLMWSALFIRRSSIIGIDGVRYYCLFDDAMISMRYAWNLSHGLGLVWNEGVRVEGFTNMLMTLYMALATALLDKNTAVLFIQISGMGFMLGIAYFTMKIAQNIFSHSDNLNFLAVLSFAVVFCYYPLPYWTLMGMETGLLALLLLAGVWLVTCFEDQPKTRPVLPVLLGLAFLARPDAVIAILLIMGYRILGIVKEKGAKKILLTEASILGAFIISLTMFRYIYYGEIVPNTYMLKMTGMPFMSRIQNGINFIRPFLKSTAMPIFIAIFAIVLNFHRSKLLLISLFLSFVVYHIWIGGDVWPYWRMMAPFVPLIFLLCIDGIANIVHLFTETDAVRQYISRASTISLPLMEKAIIIVSLFIFLAIANAEFIPEMFLYQVPYQVNFHRWNVDIAVALKEFCGPEASVAVVWAGCIPYFTGFKAIDILGKSDKYIASLPANGDTPGHNKYDLNYSVVKKRPTYVQYINMIEDNISPFMSRNYQHVHYKDICLWLLKDSKEVSWDKDDTIIMKTTPE